MARCSHCGEVVAEGQETCFACGQHVRTRAFRHEHRANPVVIIAAFLTVVVLVFGGMWFIRAKAARKQAALLAEEETVRVQDSSRRASREWQDALRVAKNDDEALAHG